MKYRQNTKGDILYGPPVIVTINEYFDKSNYRVSGNSSTKKKIKYLGHFVTKSNNYF